MRFCRFEFNDQIQIGIITDASASRVVPLASVDATLPSTMTELIQMDDIATRLAGVSSDDGPQLSEVRLLAPLESPEKVICIGLNYRDHAIETGSPIPEQPVVFCKFPTAIIGPDDPIILPSISDQVDYEAELVVVIGKRASWVSEAQAMEHVFGYTCGNDVSARDWQKGTPGGQWLLGKTFDTFAPLGPWIVEKQSMGDPSQLSVKMHVNGETLQNGSTSELIFSVSELIAHVSQIATLNPGDVIFTGTPPGVGAARTPPRFLQPGDQCSVEIENIGALNNPCIAADSDQADSFRSRRYG